MASQNMPVLYFISKVGIGEELGAVSAPSELLGRLSPPLSVPALGPGGAGCASPRVITTGASVVCTATGCK